MNKDEIIGNWLQWKQNSAVGRRGTSEKSYNNHIGSFSALQSSRNLL